jgi:two-component SAPR family response regulator
MICLLGEFRLIQNGEPLDIFGSGGKSANLLRLLAMKHASCLVRDAILDQLWPDASLELAAQSLNSLVYSLRKQLSPYLGGQAPVIAKDGFYRLNMQAGMGVDVVAFDSLARQSDLAAQSGDLELAAPMALRAVQYYQGDLYGGEDLVFTLELERLRNVYLTLLARLADDCFRKQDYSGCLQYAHRLLEYEPCREDAHRTVMRCHVRLGERAVALRQYQLCQSILLSEFAAVPEPATISLYDLIRTNPEIV